MSNCAFGFPDFTQSTPLRTVTIQGAFGVATLPLSNVLDPKLSRVARSANALSTTTVFDIDLAAACPVGLLAMLIPNLTKTSTPTVHWIGGTTVANNDVYDSSGVQAWPTGLTIDDVLQPDGSLMNVWTTIIPSSTKTARYWRCSIVDTANADGYVDVARVVIASAFRPTAVDISDGAKHQPKNDTVRTVTDGGSALYNAKRTYRTDGFSIEDFADADAATVRKMYQRLGISGQVFWIPDVTDTTYGYQRNYLGTMQELGALTANQGKTNGEFSVLEVL